MMARFSFAAALVLAGCKENLLEDLPDAASIDATEIVTPVGDFSCLTTPYPTTAPDPILVRGFLRNPALNAPVPGVPVELRRSIDDTLIGQDTSDTAPGARNGKYSISVATGGVAPQVYRKVAGTGSFLDAYSYDGIPVGFSYELSTPLQDETATQYFHDVLGIPRDLTKAIVEVHAHDCRIWPVSPVPVAGVTVEAPPGAFVVYSTPNGQPDPTLTATSSLGEAVIFNVTPGIVDIRVHAGPVLYRSWPVRAFANSWTWSVRHP